MTGGEHRLAWPLRECEPWCIDPRHHREWHPSDRTCLTRTAVVPMVSMEPVQMGDGEWQKDRVEVLMRRRPEEPAPRVVLNYEGNDRGHDVELVFTLEEATELRAHLAELIRLGEAGVRRT